MSSPAIALFNIEPSDSQQHSPPRSTFALQPLSGLQSPAQSPDIEKSKNIADSYPFIQSTTSRDIGRAGDVASSVEASQSDPLLLRERLFREDQYRGLRERISAIPQRKSRQARKVKAFYEGQNDRINNLLKPLAKHAQDASDEEKLHAGPVRIAIRASLVLNVVLAIIQIYAAVSSLSLSFFASAIDAIFDPAVTIMLFFVGRAAANADPMKYPVGGSRLISVGNVIYAGIMAAVSLVLIVESVQEIATHNAGDSDTFHLPATIAVAIAFVTKVEILYEDHRNDMVLNAFALFTNAAGAKIIWYIDPMGAIIISVVLIYLWGGSCLNELRHLAGTAAPRQLIELVIYKCMTFSDTITQIDSCKAYHNGNNYTVEVDIVMPPETPLWKAHDIAQLLQDQLETLPKVDRVFVHIDWEVSHLPEHRKYI